MAVGGIIGQARHRIKAIEIAPVYGKHKRAGSALRAQAIQRTLEESLYGFDVWGDRAFMCRMNESASGSRIKEDSAKNEALKRLSMLKAVDCNVRVCV